MKPYYKDDYVTIYHGDCREVLPTLDKVDLVLTDPPYGIGRSGQAKTTCKNPRHNRRHHEDKGWDKSPPDLDVFKSLFDISENQIIWGANYYPQYMKPSMGWIVWDKGQDFSTSDAELAYTSYQKALRRIIVNRGQINADGAVHPTQKPIKVMRFCLEYAGKDALTILDPFMGSGTTLRAAKDLGRKAIGIELEEKYCEIAAKRMSQEVFDFGADQTEQA
jgi:site-specific DNA-methyltransferase (adenine-specific)